MRKPTDKYRDLLVKANVISEEDKFVIDPNNKILSELDDVILLQQGSVNWNDWSNYSRSKIRFAITPNIHIFKELISKRLKTFLLEFPIEDHFKKTTNWNEREDAVYYHGRIIPGKLNIEELEKISSAGIKIVARGPVCKQYWQDENLEDKKFIDFKDRFMKLVDEGKILLFSVASEEKAMIYDLNRYKFYFTLSSGEAFNLALEEAIACGTIPIVRSSGAYWWADHLLVNFKNVDRLIKAFHQYKKEDLDEYSNLIANEIKKRCSLEAIKEKFEYQKEHAI